MTQLTPHNSEKPNTWKTQTYVLGAAVGTLFGLLSAYLYTRAAEEDAARTGKPEKIPTGQLLTLFLAGVSLVRQITELGKPKK